MGTVRTMILRRRHGRTIHRLQEQVRRLKGKAPRHSMREYAKMDTEQTMNDYRAAKFRADLSTRGFFSRVAWAFGYIFTGIGGAA